MLARLPSLLLFVGELARVKQTARRRQRYVAMPSSSSSAATTPTVEASSEDLSGTVAAAELRPGDTVEFGVSRMSLVRVQDMQRLGYFGGGVGWVPGAEKVPEPEGELVVFEAFFIAGLRLPPHRFVSEVLQKFEVQVHQLTPNAVVVLAKYVCATTSYGGQPSVEVFAKQYCLHWQKRKIGHKIAQFRSCTFTPKSGKTSMEVVELVPCARNKWGNWWDYWFYVSEAEVEDHPGLPAAIMCSHYYVVYPPFEVAEDDEDERALRIAARMSSGRDLVEEVIGYGVWPLAHGWALGEVCPREMPSLGGRKVRSPLFALDVRGRDPVAVVREAEDGVVRIVGRYVPKTEAQRSWDIHGSNDHLNRVFELNCLSYGGYPGEDVIDRRGKNPAAVTEDDPAPEAAPTIKKRKLGTAVGELGVSDSFAMEWMGTCVAPKGRMSSPELRESSTRMLEVTGGRWPRNVPVPRAAGEDFFTSRMARDLRVFPYGRNIAAVVSAVMNKDRQEAAQKRWAVIKLPEARPKRARGTAKVTVPGGSQPTLAVKAAAPGSSKMPESAKAVGAGGTKSAHTELRRFGNFLRRGEALPTSAQILAWTTISLVSFFLTGDTLLGRARGNLLSSRLRWQPRRCNTQFVKRSCKRRKIIFPLGICVYCIYLSSQVRIIFKDK
jgi:hypothetical protein